jgi:hypothetical protein
MALTFTSRLRTTLGDKSLRVYEVTHDGSETSMDATDFELHYVDIAIATGHTIVLSAASTVGIDLTTAYGSALAFTAMSSGAITTILAIGW